MWPAILAARFKTKLSKGMDMTSRLNGNGFARRTGWIALLTVASLLFTLGLACALPIAAFAALAALHMRLRDGVAMMGATWLVNQAVGFGFLGYPWDGSTFAWGVVIGLSGLVALGAATGAALLVRRAGWLVAGIAAFGIGFAGYEGVLYGASAFLPSSASTYSWPVISWVLQMNAVAFLALLAMRRIGQAFGVAEPKVAEGVGVAHAA
jgi:hypothetical protein